MPGPLEGVKVLDLSQVISGPMAAGWLTDQGADTIKVETPGFGDICRMMGPRKQEVSAMFLTTNRGKRSITLELKDSEEDRETLRRLIGWADVVVENFRPGAMARLGFAPADLLARHPRLILCSITGFGPSGPDAQTRVYDPLIQAASGMCASQSDPETQEPRLVQNIVCDKSTALAAAQAITAALFARERTGAGQHVEIAMLDTAVAFLWPEGLYNETFLEPEPPFPDLGSFYRLWRAKDGWVAMASVQDTEFQAVCRAIDRPDLAADPRFADLTGRIVNHGALEEELGAEIAKWETDALIRRMRAEDAVAAKVNDRASLMSDPQLQANGSILEMDHGALGRVRQPRHPARFSATPTAPPTPAPRLGEHTDAVKREMG